MFYLLVSLSCVISATTIVSVAFSLIRAVLDSQAKDLIEIDRSRLNDPHWWLIIIMAIPVLNITLMCLGTFLRLKGPFSKLAPFHKRNKDKDRHDNSEH